MIKKVELNVGTRGSQLAVIQKDIITEQLLSEHNSFDIKTVIIDGYGDQNLDSPLSEMDSIGVFCHKLELALISKDIDIAVHSLKDLSTKVAQNTVIGAISRRFYTNDIVIFKGDVLTLSELPPNSVVGTSSLRRSSQIKRHYPKLVVKDIRGNINTRLQKLDSPTGVYDAIILAHAGFVRYGVNNRKFQILENDFYYAVGQGALGVQCRKNDALVIDIIATLTHVPTALECICERELLRTLKGGCCVPIGVKMVVADSLIDATCCLYSLDGQECIQKTIKRDLPAFSLQNQSPFVIISDTIISTLCIDAASVCLDVGKNLGDEIIQSGGGKILSTIPHRCSRHI